jgi:flagellar protein FliO/FliZ
MDTVFTALRVAVSLALIIGLLWFVQRKSAKWARGKSRRPITVIGKQSLGGKSRVVIVEADGTHFVLGVTESSVVVLKSREATSFAEAMAAEEDADGNDFVESLAAPVALMRPRAGAARGRRAARPSFSDSITSAETWKKAAQSLRTGR